MLQRLIEEKWLKANAIIGIFPASSNEHDDIEVYDETGTEVNAVFHTLRQQTKKPAGQCNLALSDFIRPKQVHVVGGPKTDFVGVFALTTGIGIDEHVKAFENQHDDYSAILLKALADRLAEAFAELLHQKVRKEIWAYAPDEKLRNDELIQEGYRGIRPAPGYPAQPDHTEKLTIWKLMNVEKETGISLTESLAMVPTAAVSGLYLGSPHAQYFGVGKLSKDQVEDYAKRKGLKTADAEKWLRPVLGYEEQ
jgi:5-methyltetrahydrofolate--homocysteine methyltransferase